MGITKRYVESSLTYVTPDVSSDTDRFLILMNLSQANNVGILEQLSLLFEYTHEIFTDIVEEAVQTNNRIKSLSGRVFDLQNSLAQTEESAKSSQSLRNTAVSYSNKSEEVACQFLPEYRIQAIQRQHENCMAPPNLGVLDEFAGGESCLKKYTNPLFFLETWVEEQKRIYEEARQKRAQRRKGKKRNTSAQTQKIVVKQVELRRVKYNAMGQEFSGSAPSSGPSSGPMEPRKMESLSSNDSSSPIQSNTAPTAPAPSSTPQPTVQAKRKTTKPDKKGKEEKKKDSKKEKTKTDKKEKTKTDKKADAKDTKKKKPSSRSSKHPSSVEINDLPPPSGLPPPIPTESDFPLPPASIPPPPPKDVAPPIPEQKLPPPVVSIPAPTITPPPPPVVAPPPPPGNIPPPPPPGNIPPPPPAVNIPPPPSGGGLLGALANQQLKSVGEVEKKPVEKRSALLDAIQKGTTLKKVEKTEAPKNQSETAFNVAKILARRAAIECSDEEDSDEDDDWDD